MGTVFWITGLSGAGKTTIGRAFHRRWKAKFPATVFLDGDSLREAFGNDLGHSREDRLRCARRYSGLCKLLADQGVDVVISTISLFHEIHARNRAQLTRYREIYVKVPLALVQAKDPKGVYRGEEAVGDHIPAEEPLAPHVVIENDRTLSAEQIADALLRDMLARKE